MRRNLLITAILAGFVLLPIGYLCLLSWLSGRPSDLGAVDGKLRVGDPNKPNWVSTFATSEDHAAEAIACPEAEATECVRRLEKTVNGLPRARVVSRTDDYLHVEFRSAIFRFVDDVEFLVDPNEGVIHFTSAARTGHSDFGVNRERMETIRGLLAANSD